MASSRPSVDAAKGPGRSRLAAGSWLARHRAIAAAADPLAWVLLAAGVVDGFSDNWVHAVFLMIAAGAVWAERFAEAAGHPGRPSVPLLAGAPGTTRGRRRGRWIAGAVVAMYALGAGAAQAYTWPMTVAVVVPAVVGLVLAWRGPLRDRPVPAPLGRRAALAWWALLVVGGLWELSALLQQPSLQVSSADHPTISFLMESVLATPLGRVLTVAAWLAFGWFLLAQAPGETATGERDELA